MVMRQLTVNSFLLESSPTRNWLVTSVALDVIGCGLRVHVITVAPPGTRITKLLSSIRGSTTSPPAPETETSQSAGDNGKRIREGNSEDPPSLIHRLLMGLRSIRRRMFESTDQRVLAVSPYVPAACGRHDS